MEGFKTERHEQNPKEKEFHDKFLRHHNRDGYADMENIVFGNDGRPKGSLTDREKQIVVSTIQWLGSPVGQGFLSDCGFTKTE